MSTKIFNGYRMRTLNSLELNEFILELRERLLDILLDKFDRIFSSNAGYNIYELILLDDEYKTTKDPTKIEKFLEKLYNDYGYSIECVVENHYRQKKEEKTLKEIKKSLNLSYFGSIYELSQDYVRNRCKHIAITNKRNNPYDFISDLCLFPRDENYTLFLAYGDDFESMLDNICHSRKKKDKEFRQKFGLEYYGYWNCSDKPDNITNKAWSKRCDDWDFLRGVPSMTGIPIDVLSYEAFFDLVSLKRFRGERVVTGKYFKAIEEIHGPYAKAKLKRDFIDSHKNSNEEVTVSKCLDIVEEFENLFKNEDPSMMEEYNKLVEHYKEILPVITIEMTLETVMDFLPNYLEDYPITKEVD